MVATLDNDAVRTADDHAGFEQMASLLAHFARWLHAREAKVQKSYLVPERDGFGWYVIAKEPVFDFELNKQLAEFGASLIRKGFAIHAVLLPGSVSPDYPADAIVVMPSGQVMTHTD